jgi:transcriptional regulator with XRE-family HTH domain
MSISDRLKQAISQAGTLYSVAKGSGVTHPSLLRFMSGERDIRLETADKLAAYLGLELQPKSQSKKKPSRKVKG